MTREEIIETIRDNATAIKAEGVTKLALFRIAHARRSSTDSDIDILVNIKPDASFSVLDLIGVQHIIEDATGLKAQATLRRSIPDRFAKQIADDLVEVF